MFEKAARLSQHLGPNGYLNLKEHGFPLPDLRNAKAKALQKVKNERLALENAQKFVQEEQDFVKDEESAAQDIGDGVILN